MFFSDVFFNYLFNGVYVHFGLISIVFLIDFEALTRHEREKAKTLQTMKTLGFQWFLASGDSWIQEQIMLIFII